MPPKLRRPAAVEPRAGRGRRRPAAREEVDPPEGVAGTPDQRFDRGETVELAQLPILSFKVGQLPVFENAKYFGGSCKVRICPPDCPGEPHAPGLLHSCQVRAVKKEDEKDLTWELNLESNPEDEMVAFRRKQEELERQRDEAKEKGEGEKAPPFSKEKKGKGKEEEEVQEFKSVKHTTQEGGEVERQEKEEDLGWRKVLKYARKKMRRRATSSSSSGTSSDSRSEKSSEDGQDLLQDSNKIRSFHRYGPGILAAMEIGQMKESIVELEGLWKEEDSSLPPIAMRYVRSTLQAKLSGGALREALTLASMMDLMMMGRMSEAADLGMQRLKSIERVSQGSPWSSTEKLELIGTLSPQISTRGELTAAQKELRLDQQSKGGTPQYKGKGVAAPDFKGKKGPENGKGKKSGDGDRANKEKREK
eukprot:s180_g31.t1